MKQYVIDELRPTEENRLRTFMDENYGPAEMGGIYWIRLPDALLTDVQASHTGCRPFYFVADMNNASISQELLVRTRNAIRCSCIGYATAEQRDWIIRLMDDILKELNIIT